MNEHSNNPVNHTDSRFSEGHRRPHTYGRTWACAPRRAGTQACPYAAHFARWAGTQAKWPLRPRYTRVCALTARLRGCDNGHIYVHTAFAKFLLNIFYAKSAS